MLERLGFAPAEIGDLRRCGVLDGKESPMPTAKTVEPPSLFFEDFTRTPATRGIPCHSYDDATRFALYGQQDNFTG